MSNYTIFLSGRKPEAHYLMKRLVKIYARWQPFLGSISEKWLTRMAETKSYPAQRPNRTYL